MCAVKGLLALGVVVLCGLGIFIAFQGSEFWKTHRDTVMAEPESSQSAEDVVQQKASVTEAPEPVAHGKKIKRHKEGKAIWAYNKETKCLVISGEGKISDHGIDESVVDIDPDFYPWDKWEDPAYRPDYADQVEEIVIKSGITDINKGAFHEYQSLKTVRISSTVTNLGEYAFWRCGSLNQVTVGDGVKEIQKGTFNGCSSLTEFTVGRNVEKINSDAFLGCSSLERLVLDQRNTNFTLESGILYDRQKTVLYLCPAVCPSPQESLNIPTSVREIAPAAFSQCRSVKKLVIPAGVEKIGNYAFSQCKKLEEVSFSAQSKCYWLGLGVFDDCVSLKEILLPDSVKYVSSGFVRCKSLQRVYLGSSFVGFTSADTWEEAEQGKIEPSFSKFMGGISDGKIKEFQVSAVNAWYSSQDGVLYNKNKTRLLCYPQKKKDKKFQVPDSVEVIRGSAFYGTSYLEQVILSRSLRRIGGWAFAWGKSIKSVEISGKDVVIASYAFACCPTLSQVELGSSVREIRKSAFYDTGLKEIHVPSSVKKIGSEALGKWCKREKLEGGASRGTTLDVMDFIIFGKKGSAAERYAKKYVFHFIRE